MPLAVNWKFAVITMVIFMYDVWLNLFSYLIYSIYEVAEYYLEVLIRILFGVQQHTSEVIVFYLLFFIIFCVMARLWFLSPRIYAYFSALSESYKLQFLIFWQALALLERIKLSAVYLFTSFSFVFLMF